MESPLANRVFLLPHTGRRLGPFFTRPFGVYVARPRLCWNSTLGHTSTCRVGDRTDDSGSSLGLSSHARDFLTSGARINLKMDTLGRRKRSGALVNST